MKSRAAFTLIELLLVIAIIALLGSLLTPTLQGVMGRAHSTACAANLRQIGVSVNLYAGEHNMTYPQIETDPTNPVYPAEMGVKGMLETLAPYGTTEKVLRCQADLKGQNRFAQRGTSYEWRPVVDGESTVNPQIYHRFGAISVPPARIRQVMDIDAVHNGRQNVLYGDGHVRGN